MIFNQGQRVRIRGRQSVGTVDKKLTSLNNVYVVMIDSAPSTEEKLVRGDDLEVLTEETPEGSFSGKRLDYIPPGACR